MTIYESTFTEEEKQLAKDNNWINAMNDYCEVGNLGEILVAKFRQERLGEDVSWKPNGRKDNGDDVFFWSKRWQIKSVKDEPEKRFMSIDKRGIGFENYIYVLISQDKSYGQILYMGGKDFVELNSTGTPWGGKGIKYK